MAKWDLTPKISQYLDRHLVFPLLEFLSVKEIYDERDMVLAKSEIVRNTKMIDFSIDCHKILYPGTEIPEELLRKRAEVVSELKQDQESTNYYRDVLKDETVQKQIEQTRDGRTLLDFLVKNKNFKVDSLDSIYLLAKRQYECGIYQAATEYLYLYRLLVPTSDKNYLNAMWGQLAAEILMQNWDAALDDFNRLKEYIDTSV